MRREYFSVIAIALLATLSAFFASCSKGPDKLVEGWTTTLVFESISFQRPVYMLERGDRFYVLEQTGRILSFNGFDGGDPNVFLDLRDMTNFNQRAEGSRSFAFHPKFDDPDEPLPYVYFYNQLIRNGQRYDRLSRFTVDKAKDAVDVESEDVLIEQEVGAGGHRGGHILFGPDGFLYVSIGDKDVVNMEFIYSQLIDHSLFSGIIRIDVDQLGGDISHPIKRQPKVGYTQNYYIPKDNPFVGEKDVLEEFWSIGFREPFRMNFDSVTQELWVGEVGNFDAEEINIASKATNHQWQYAEGSKFFNDKNVDADGIHGIDTPPISVLKHSDGYCAIIGGIVYRGSKFPDLYGKYIYGEWCTGTIFAYDRNPTAEKEANIAIARVKSSSTRETDHGLSSFFESSDGDIYMLVSGAMESATGRILKLEKTKEIEKERLPATLRKEWELGYSKSKPNIVDYELAAPSFNNGAVSKYRVVLPVGDTGDPVPISVSEAGDFDFPVGTAFVKHLLSPGSASAIETQVILKRGEGDFDMAAYEHSEGGDLGAIVRDAPEGLVDLGLHDESFEWMRISASACLGCHNASSKEVRGFTIAQLDVEGQIDSLNQRGIFAPRISEAHLKQTDALAKIDDLDAPLEDRARTYLEVNCAYCHQPNGLGAGNFDARISTAISEQNLIGGDVIGAAALLEMYKGEDVSKEDVDKMKVVSPGDPESSLILLRMDSKVSAGKMPPFGVWAKDDEAISVISEWILSLPEKH